MSAPALTNDVLDLTMLDIAPAALKVRDEDSPANLEGVDRLPLCRVPGLLCAYLLVLRRDGVLELQRGTLGDAEAASLTFGHHHEWRPSAAGKWAFIHDTLTVDVVLDTIAATVGIGIARREGGSSFLTVPGDRCLIEDAMEAGRGRYSSGA